MLSTEAIIPRDCRTPKFAVSQVVLTRTEDRSTYLTDALCVDRRSGLSSYGHQKPREEVCYTVSGEPYTYSNIAMHTIPYPKHVKKIIPLMMDRVQAFLPRSVHPEDLQLSNGVDILYSNKFKLGGSIGAHADDEMHWPLVIIFSLGQSRWLRIRRKSDGAWFNVKMADNSVVGMSGNSFQQLYTHQVDKLSDDEFVFCRLSVNIRFCAAKPIVRLSKRSTSLSPPPPSKESRLEPDNKVCNSSSSSSSSSSSASPDFIVAGSSSKQQSDKKKKNVAAVGTMMDYFARPSPSSSAAFSSASSSSASSVKSQVKTVATELAKKRKRK